MTRPMWARRLRAAVRAEHPEITDEQLEDAFGILEALGLEDSDDDDVAERFATRIAELVVDLVDEERIRRGLPPLKDEPS